MHPDLLNNSLFLKYYNQWQKNPQSIVFASIAEFFLKYGLLDEALKVCREGLKHHPNLTTGRIVMAKVHLTRGNFEEAKEELEFALKISPINKQAKDLLDKVQSRQQIPSAVSIMENVIKEEEESEILPEWQTVTMAKIYAAQGHTQRAEQIFHSILEREPENEDAHRGLASINS